MKVYRFVTRRGVFIFEERERVRVRCWDFFGKHQRKVKRLARLVSKRDEMSIAGRWTEIMAIRSETWPDGSAFRTFLMDAPKITDERYLLYKRFGLV